ncbi:unnamed protein product [Symbiodinium sp. CCMP2592]|nr:unnamed protein product [Symbiodinium sp. CCMP2592]
MSWQSGDWRDWSDEEWKQYRLLQKDGKQAEPARSSGLQEVGQEAANQRSSGHDGNGPGPGQSCKLQLPASWKVDMNPNEIHGAKDFAKIRRDCNRQLQKMYNVWQAELEEQRENHAVELRASVANCTTSNNLLLEEKQRSFFFGQQVIDLEAKLVEAQKEQKGEQQKLQMEHEAKRLLDQSNFEKAKKELENQHKDELSRAEKEKKQLESQHKDEQTHAEKVKKQLEQDMEKLVEKHKTKIMDLQAEHSRETKELNSKHRKKIVRMKLEVAEYRKKVNQNTTRWGEQLARQTEVAKQAAKEVAKLKRELSLAEDPGWNGSELLWTRCASWLLRRI